MDVIHVDGEVLPLHYISLRFIHFVRSKYNNFMDIK
jgi:hypothetical protein